MRIRRANARAFARRAPRATYLVLRAATVLGGRRFGTRSAFCVPHTGPGCELVARMERRAMKIRGIGWGLVGYSMQLLGCMTGPNNDSVRSNRMESIIWQ